MEDSTQPYCCNPLDTRLEKFLGLQLSCCAGLYPEDCNKVAMVTKLSLADCCLEEVPSRLPEFTDMTDLDISGNPLGGFQSSIEKLATAALSPIIKINPSWVTQSERNAATLASVFKNSTRLTSVK